MIVGISGKMRSGKDTVAEYIVNKYGFEHLKFSTGIKEIYDMVNYKEDDGVKPRRALQEIGQTMRRVIGQDVWIEYTLKDYDPSKNTVISDVRQDNEFHALRERGALIILVTTSPRVQKERLMALGETEDEYMSHETEIITESLADIHIVNDSSLEELYYQIDSILSPLITRNQD